MPVPPVSDSWSLASTTSPIAANYGSSHSRDDHDPMMTMDLNGSDPLVDRLGRFPFPDLPEEDLLPPDLSAEIKLVFVVLYVLIMLMSVVGNLFVVIVITKNKKMRTVTNLFLVSLAVSDMLIASLNMPFQLMFYVQNEWTLGDFLCKFVRYLQGVFIVASILTLTGIAIDR